MWYNQALNREETVFTRKKVSHCFHSNYRSLSSLSIFWVRSHRMVLIMSQTIIRVVSANSRGQAGDISLLSHGGRSKSLVAVTEGGIERRKSTKSHGIYFKRRCGQELGLHGWRTSSYKDRGIVTHTIFSMGRKW